MYVQMAIVSSCSAVGLVVFILLVNDYKLSQLEACIVIFLQSMGFLTSILFASRIRIAVNVIGINTKIFMLILSACLFLVCLFLVIYKDFLFIAPLLYLYGFLNCMLSIYILSAVNSMSDIRSVTKQRVSKNIGTFTGMILLAILYFFNITIFIYPTLISVLLFFIFLRYREYFSENDQIKLSPTLNKDIKSIGVINVVSIFLVISIYYIFTMIYPLEFTIGKEPKYLVFIFIMSLNAIIVILFQKIIYSKIMTAMTKNQCLVSSFLLMMIGYLIPLDNSIVSIIFSVYLITLGEIIIFSVLTKITIDLSSNSIKDNVSVASLNKAIYFLAVSPTVIFSLIVNGYFVDPRVQVITLSFILGMLAFGVTLTGHIKGKIIKSISSQSN